jgi:hypothetical protein
VPCMASRNFSLHGMACLLGGEGRGGRRGGKGGGEEGRGGRREGEGEGRGEGRRGEGGREGGGGEGSGSYRDTRYTSTEIINFIVHTRPWTCSPQAQCNEIPRI